MTDQAQHDVSPVFIVGMPRSGTTLFSAMLSAHPRIAIAPESHFLNLWMHRFSHLDLAWQEAFTSFWQAFSKGEQFSHFGVEAEAVEARIRAAKRQDFATVFRVLLEEYAARSGKTRWGEKTPFHYRHMDVLSGWYPEARFVFMVRDPRAVVSSLLAVPWAHNYAHHHAWAWRNNMRILEAWKDDGRVLPLPYERLVTDTEAAMRDVCAFLGETYAPAVLDPSRTSMPIVNEQGWSKEALEKARKPVTTASLEKWRTVLTPYQVAVIEHITRAGMHAHGYTPETDSLGPRYRLTWAAQMAAHNAGRAYRALRHPTSIPARIRNFRSARI